MANKNFEIAKDLVNKLKTPTYSKAAKEGLKEKIKKLLDDNPNYQDINLGQKSIGASECVLLADVLQDNKTIKKLNLAGNKIGIDGCSAIGNMLKSNETIVKLSLDGNRFGADGCKSIADGLAGNNSLTELSLDDNNVGDEGCIALAKAIEVNQTLTKLVFGGTNNVGKDGCEALADALQSNYSVTWIGLYGGEVDETSSAYKQIEAACTRNKTTPKPPKVEKIPEPSVSVPIDIEVPKPIEELPIAAEPEPALTADIIEQPDVSTSEVIPEPAQVEPETIQPVVTPPEDSDSTIPSDLGEQLYEFEKQYSMYCIVTGKNRQPQILQVEMGDMQPQSLMPIENLVVFTESLLSSFKVYYEQQPTNITEEIIQYLSRSLEQMNDNLNVPNDSNTVSKVNNNEESSVGEINPRPSEIPTNDLPGSKQADCLCACVIS